MAYLRIVYQISKFILSLATIHVTF
jgi:hypothetical protein